IFSNGGSSVLDSDSEFSSVVIAMNSSNSTKISSSRRVPSMEWRILPPLSRRASKSSSKISSIMSILKHVSSFEHFGLYVDKRYVDSDGSDHVEKFSVLGLRFFFSKALRIWNFWFGFLLGSDGVSSGSGGVEGRVGERVLSSWKALGMVCHRVCDPKSVDCNNGSRPKEQHLVVPCSDEEIVSGEDGSNLEEFLNVLTIEEADITGPIIKLEDEPLMMIGSGPNIIKEDFSNDLHRQRSTNENLPNTMSISKTFNVSDIYEFHFEDMNEGKHSRTSSSKERGNDEDMIQELAEKYMVSKNK
nr:transposon Ty3-I Gag-Pol polyprotein [Tanacetum cinerariifolium]